MKAQIAGPLSPEALAELERFHETTIASVRRRRLLRTRALPTPEEWEARQAWYRATFATLPYEQGGGQRWSAEMRAHFSRVKTAYWAARRARRTT